MKVYGKWKLSLPGEEYVYDPDQWSLSVWRQVEADLDMNYQQFNAGLSRKVPDVCQWLIWYLRREAGRVEDRFSVDFPMLQLGLEEIPDSGEAVAADTPPSETAT